MPNYIPDEYKGRLFLKADDIQKMLELGENKTYEFLANAPFRVERIGNQLRIHAVSFWKWYAGE